MSGKEADALPANPLWQWTLCGYDIAEETWEHAARTGIFDLSAEVSVWISFPPNWDSGEVLR